MSLTVSDVLTPCVKEVMSSCVNDVMSTCVNKEVSGYTLLIGDIKSVGW